MGTVHRRSASVDIDFVSTVRSEMRGRVEDLFFFNPRQTALGLCIRQTIERFGSPEIIEQAGRLWIGTARFPMQCLFACDRNVDPDCPIGVVLYSRSDHETLTVIHVAADPDYTTAPEDLSAELGLILIGQVRRIARQLKGIRRVELPYRRARYLPVL